MAKMNAQQSKHITNMLKGSTKGRPSKKGNAPARTSRRGNGKKVR